MKSVSIRLLLVLLLPLSFAARADQFTILVEPSFPPEQVQEIYQPLTDYLEKSTGHQFKVVSPRNYHFYWRDLRRNDPVDFIFEDAHFTDYRAQRFGFTPLARKAEPTSYALLADPQHADRGLDGLVGRRIVTMPSPSLGFALLAESFKNPMSLPEYRSEASSWRDGVEMVFSGDAEAAVVPEHIARQYPNLVEVTRSREFSGTIMSAAPSVPDDVKQAVRDALLAMHEDESAYNVLVEIGATAFQPATDADYKGAEKVLSSFFGYEPVN